MLPIYDLNTDDGRASFETRIGQLRDTASACGEFSQTAAEVIEAVRRDGDDEVIRQARLWSDPDFTLGRLCVSSQELSRAEQALTGPLRAAVEKSIEHVNGFQKHLMAVPDSPVVIDGCKLAMRFTPVTSLGIHIPGTGGGLFSTLIMLAVPAIVAGVEPANIVVACSPPLRRHNVAASDISPTMLGLCHMLGLQKVYRMGGPAAFAAMALGTDSVAPVDMIAGPSHPSGQAAKVQLAGVVGTDGFYGASEIATLADDTARCDCIAADMIAQAEHDPGKCFLVAWSKPVIDRVIEQIGQQIQRRSRRTAIESALQTESCAVLVADQAQGIEAVNTIAAEHVNLAVANPDMLLPAVRNAGEIFLGDNSPVAAGDYYAGPSHCLPTGTTARFASGISIYSFLKRTAIVGYPKPMSDQTVEDIARLADAEGLDGHAHSVRIRK